MDLILNPTRRMIEIEKRIRYIENVIKRLKPYEKDIFNNIFKDNYSWQYCETLGISKTTYYNIYNKSIYYAAEEFGEI